MFPNYLDGAKVKYYTKKDDFGTVDCNDGKKTLDIKHLAICSYANERGFYLFFCDEKFNTVSDYFFDTVEECKIIAENSKENIVWIEKTNSAAEFTFEEIKTLLLKSIDEYHCEAELHIFFADNPEEYMIIIYKDHCSFQRCGSNDKKSSGEYNYKSLDELYTAAQVDDIILKRDWDKITAFNCEDFEILGFWK